MSTLTHTVAAVKPNRPTCRECGAADFHRIDCPIDHPATCRVLPVDCRPEPDDDVPTAPYAAEDQAWWADHCDHTGWTHPAELSPDEQDEELDHLDRYNAALEAMYAATIEAERIEAGCYAW